MNFKLFVALRYLFSRRKHSLISLISIISVLGVAIGVAALIVSMGVMNGFSTDLRNKILSFNSHIIVYNMFGPSRENNRLEEQIKEVKDVIGVTPFVYTELMISSSAGVKGVMMRGIEKDTVLEVVDVLSKLEAGSLALLAPDSITDSPPLAGIIIGAGLAEHLKVEVGGRVNLLSPTGTRSSAGAAPKIKAFRVAGIFKSGMMHYDTSCTFADKNAVREIIGMADGFLTGYEVKIKNIFEADSVALQIEKKLLNNYIAKPWTESNSELFAALKLEKLAMSVVLTLIVIVASFSIISTLIMLVLEKTKDIAILMSMGATAKTIKHIFMFQGLIIGIAGTILGFIFGLSIAYLLGHYKFIELPKGIYSVDYVPVLLQTQDLLAIAAGAVLICFLVTIYPAQQAAKLTPTEALHYE